ncbi:hypothetical protein [Mesorhizobium sp.]|uniref:hypothetical protein n=1 Tax=Mesorhizobium sp. TaxID=1871066 RepID=UPI000FE4E91C|nr:hypothetical protein [Mesorhizobium sp.]RWG00451.1 MAG: hypothetical protein EOQ54_26600 [Mesorhizobium sp.]RWG95545.1 MAG: hypothetical protein EOQ72_24290 [Mesorhizobium sp.]
MGYGEWLASLTPREYEIFTLILDKGALALLLAAIGALIAVLLERYREQREKIEVAAREDRERSMVPRTQLDIECRFFGPLYGKIIVNVHLVAENRGKTIRGFNSIRFRVFTMTDDEVPGFFGSKDGMSRLALNGPRVDEKTREGYIFSVEPGVRQIFPFTTLIAADTKYVSVKIDVQNADWGGGGSLWLGEERFFPVRLERPDSPVAAGPAMAAHSNDTASRSKSGQPKSAAAKRDTSSGDI